MKKVKLYAMAFAAMFFAASCQDDAIDPGQGQGNGTDGTPAYLTISFTANGGSSTRADNDANKGDNHGNAEDSNHESTGITGESQIKTALVVVNPTSNAANAFGFAKVYTVVGADDAETATGDNFVLAEQNTQTYNAEPIEVTTGEYNVMVVLNPAAALTGTTYFEADGGQQTEDITKVRALYEEILNGTYSFSDKPTTETWTDSYTNVANSIGMGVGYGTEGHNITEKAQFMMANKAASTVTVTPENDIYSPAQANVTVERVLSKITFREKAEANGVAKNAYQVKVTLGSAPAITEEGAVAKQGQEGQYEIKKLNKALDVLKNEVYGEYDEDGALVAVYKVVMDEQSPAQPKKVTVDSKEYILYKVCEAKSIEDYQAEAEKENGDTSAMYAVTDTENPTIELVTDPDAEVTTDTWYVQLQGFALVNLSKSVNYVRHTVSVGNGGVVNPFGELTGTSYYLWTPGWADKNGATYNDDGSFDNFTAANYFYNTLEQVSNESKTLTVGTNGIDLTSAQYFKSFDALIEDKGTVSGTDHYADEPNLPAYGNLMTYCFENSTDVDHQIHGLSTGIAFVARIYKNQACTEPIEKLYLYANHTYTSLQQIADSYANATPQAIKDLLEKENVTKEDLENAGVTEYNSNICYYYTTEIKHFDNNDPNELGVMEYAIMRNNIYSLSVTNIKEIGAPFVDPTPNIPNESTMAALDINVQIEPWIVRYNDIEF